jgi:hypothetical protein
MNVGETDRMVRIGIGALAGLISLAILANVVQLPELASPVLGLAAVVLLGTGYTGMCPIYSLLGVDTCSASPR